MKLNGFVKKYDSLSDPAKAALWFAVCGILQKGIQFLTTPIFTRLLSTEQYGEINIYLSWYNIVTIFLTLNLFLGGFNNGMVQNENRRDEYLSAMQGLVTVITAGFFVFYIMSRKIWNSIFEMNTLMVSVMFLEILFHSALSFWSARERFEYRYKKLIVYTISVIAIPSIAAIVAIIITPDNYGTEAKVFTNAFFVIVLCLPLYFRNIKKGHSFYHKEFWSFGFKFNAPLVPHYLSGIVLNQADRIMIQKMVGKSESGIYSLAYSASMVLNVVTTAINQSFAPWLYGKLKKEKYEDISKVTIPLFIIASVLILILVAFAPECVVFFGGNAYKEAIWIIPAVATSLYFNFVFQIFANVEFYYMRNKYITYASVTGAILNIILNYFAIQWFGYIAAGYTTLICYIVFAISHSLFVKKVSKECIEGRRIFNTKAVFIIGAVLTAFSQMILLVYKHIIIRYSLLFGLLLIVVFGKNKIIRIIKEIRKV